MYKRQDLIDGNGGSDVAMDNSGFWITVDLGSKKTVTGIKTQHWSSGYAPSKVVIYISEDGNKWKSMGDIRTSGSTQNISLKVPMDLSLIHIFRPIFPLHLLMQQVSFLIINITVIILP